jgi:hypothetical protein
VDPTDGSPEELSGLGHQQLAEIESIRHFQALFGAMGQHDHASQVRFSRRRASSLIC